MIADRRIWYRRLQINAHNSVTMPDVFLAGDAMFEQVRIVLINTSHPGNIGAVARALKNMGFSRLYLVAPESFPDPIAESRASGATDILDKAIVVSSLDEAIAGCRLVVGASARGRKIPWPVVNPRDLAREIHSLTQDDSEVAILFGREARGLTNEELHRCNLHVHIPSNPDFSSLNLAMAVQVVTYELRMKYLESLENEAGDSNMKAMLSPQDSGWDVEPASVDEVEMFLEHLERTLIDIDFHDPEHPRQLMARLRRLYQRCCLDKMELNILRGILRSTQKVAGTWGAQSPGSQ